MRASAAVWNFARAVTWLYYRVERVGQPLPAGPVLIVANHPNGLLDPPLVVATAGREARFLAKSTLFTMPLVGWLVRGAGAIPVYRKTDAGVDTKRNAEMFAAVEQALAAGDAVCLFPEGTTHSRGRLDPLKTGAARIALGTASKGIPVRIVAVGLNLDEKSVLRSAATVGYGQPFDCAHLLDLYARDPHAAVERLTEEIALHIRDLVVEAEPLNEADLVRKIDRIYRAAKGLPDDPTARLARRQLIAERLLPALQADHPALYDDLVETVRRYDRRLQRFGLSEGVVGGQPDRRVVVRFAIRESITLLALLPILVAGTAVFAAPYFLIKWLTTRVIPIELEEQATYKVFGGMLIYPPWVALVATLAGRAWGAPAGWGLAVVLPLLAVAALLASEREAAAWDTVTSYFAWQRLSPGAARAMVSQRRTIAGTVDHLTEYLRLSDQAAEPGGATAARDGEVRA